jgi:hypothetical protein
MLFFVFVILVSLLLLAAFVEISSPQFMFAISPNCDGEILCARMHLPIGHWDEKALLLKKDRKFRLTAERRADLGSEE